MKRYCPSCGKETEWEMLKRPEIFEVRGEKIEVQTESNRCENCGTEFEDLNSKNDPYDQAYREYRHRKGMIQPEQIREFRKKYNLTQKELADLLGLGDVTLSRYENGALQDEVHDKLLGLAMDPINLQQLVIQKRYLLTKEKFNAISKIIKKEIIPQSFYFQFFDENENTILTGNRPLDFEKINQVVRFFSYNREIVKSKLLKLLFYVDFKHFKETNRSITGLKYARLPYGPVPNEYELLLGFILKNDPSLNNDAHPVGDYIGEFLSTNSPYEQTLFLREELDTLHFVDAFFSKMTAKEIEDYSHKEEAYQKTMKGSLITYEYAKTLSI